MAHPQETRDRVRQLYVEGMALSSAARAEGVSYDTARSWKTAAQGTGGDWDDAKTAYSISAAGVDDLNQRMVEDFARQIILTTREVENAKIGAADKVKLLAQLADAYSKFSKGFGRINPKFAGLSVALDTITTMVNHLRLKDPEALKAIQPHIEEIGIAVGQKYDGK